MSATSVIESGQSVTKAAEEVMPTPPFTLACQLMVNTTDPSDLLEEQNRLQKVLHDDTLDSIHKQLWYAGRKGNVSQLHHQKVIRRDIILTERARLHLVWSDKTIYVKRLDDELLDWEYFSKVVCGNEVVYQAASGFLLSYARLIEYPSDLKIAKTLGLVNKDIEWKAWQSATCTIATSTANFASVDLTRYAV
jgi:hypothetical protein